jgi:hypothetical protein
VLVGDSFRSPFPSKVFTGNNMKKATYECPVTGQRATTTPDDGWRYLTQGWIRLEESTLFDEATKAKSKKAPVKKGTKK